MNYHLKFLLLQLNLEMSSMRIITFIKNWTLLCSLIVGTVIYLLFSEISFLEPTGDFMGPKLVDLMPFVISTMLYITFCKMQIHDLRPRTWHFVLQGIRTALSGLTVIAIQFVKEPEIKLLLEGVFICVICPTAAAAPVITEKLGGNIASLTMFLLIANVVTSIIIPLFFPLVEKGADISFIGAFFMVLKRVIMVLVFPPCTCTAYTEVSSPVIQLAQSLQKHSFLFMGFQFGHCHGVDGKEYYPCYHLRLGTVHSPFYPVLCVHSTV
jgi:predicted Na+-dependent transporter